MRNHFRPRVLFVAAHDSSGGAARAVHRVFQSIRTELGQELDIFFRVIHKTRNDPKIIGGKPTRSPLEHWDYLLRTRFRKYFPRRPFESANRVLHSQARFKTGLAREINDNCPDVIMLGWLGNSTLSIEEIGALAAPVVWRLSDMWMFAGAEHYTPDSRYEDGYSRQSRPTHESGPDINRETFLRKTRHWQHPRHVICPSTWMATQVKKSQLTKEWPVHVIPNPIDTDIWAPVPRSIARTELGLSDKDLIVLFGAGGGTRDHHKGPDIFFRALSTLQALLEQAGDQRTLCAVVFGEAGPEKIVGSVPVKFLGHLGDQDLRLAYSAANVMVVPSRLDNFPSTAVEAQSCGTPVAAFRVGGLVDIVDDTVTGKLANPEDSTDLARAIAWIVEDGNREKSLSIGARTRAIELWNPTRVAEQYAAVLLAASRRDQK